MNLIDANVFIRYLIGDAPAKQQRSKALLDRLRLGQEGAFTTEVMLHEACYVLSASTHYSLTHQEIRDRLYPIVALPTLHLTHKSLCLEALNIFASGERVDFSDALAITYVRNGLVKGIYSYDRKLDNIPGSARVNP